LGLGVGVDSFAVCGDFGIGEDSEALCAGPKLEQEHRVNIKQHMNAKLRIASTPSVYL